MSEISIDDWTKYRVSCNRRSERIPLESVSHVTHIRHAIEIARNRRIKSQLIYDKSRLNKKRILVAWLSPNDWMGAGGFRYGNVSFDFDWTSLINGREYFWVGAMEYKPCACRILITDIDRSNKLTRYDPSLGDGPWFWDKKVNKHYWNGEYCLEFMYEGDLLLDDAKQIRFVFHHPNRCSIDPGGCPDRGYDRSKAGKIFLAALGADKLSIPDHLFPGDHGDDDATTELQDPWRRLMSNLRRLPVEGKRALDKKKKKAYARAVLAALSRDDQDEAKCFSVLFRSTDKLVRSCANILNDSLQLDGIRQLSTTEDE